MSTDFIKVLELESQSLLQAMKRLSEPVSQKALSHLIEKLTDSLNQKGKIIVTGVGKSGKVGQKIAATLTSTGSLSIFLHPTEALHGDLGAAQREDVLIALSYTGNSEEIVRLAQAVKGRVRAIIAITSRKDSSLGELADHWIDATVDQEACPHNLAPTSSTTLMLALGDAIAVSLMKARKFEPSDFARNHPGGALGKKLMKVSELMQSGDKLASVSPQATAQDVIEESTRKKLGGVLVVQNHQLQGLITDGDIRRALGHKEKFFTLKAEQIMTVKPITIAPDTLAADAIHLMENRSSQISVLPVVDSNGKAVGLIRLHDLLRSL